MPRRAPAARREVQPDAIYNNRLVTQLTNKVLLHGKKSIAERTVYGAFDMIEAKTSTDPLSVFKKAMDNVRPALEVKPKRVGGSTYQIPVEVRADRRISLGMRWLIESARRRNGKSMSDKLAAEFLDASNGIGAAVKRREDTHRMAEANKAFSHFKW